MADESYFVYASGNSKQGSKYCAVFIHEVTSDSLRREYQLGDAHSVVGLAKLILDHAREHSGPFKNFEIRPEGESRYFRPIISSDPAIKHVRVERRLSAEEQDDLAQEIHSGLQSKLYAPTKASGED